MKRLFERFIRCHATLTGIQIEIEKINKQLLHFGNHLFVLFAIAVWVAIALFGAGSPVALATIVGVLTEVPVMLADQALYHVRHCKFIFLRVIRGAHSCGLGKRLSGWGHPAGSRALYDDGVCMEPFDKG